MTFDKRPPILRDFSGAGKGELRTLLDRPADEFRTSQRIHPDGTEDTAKTRGFLDTEVRRRRKAGKEPEEFPFYGVPISNTALYGFKSDDTPMSPPAYWGEPSTGEVQRGGALIYVGGRRDAGRVKKNKTWVTKPASGGFQAHPGNCWWEDDREPNPNKRLRVSWWGPFGPLVDRSTTFNATVPELGLSPLTWHKVSGTPDQLLMEYNYLGAPVRQGLVFVDGVLELTLNRSIVAAAFYFDGNGKKFLRFLAMSEDYPHDYYDGNISNLQFCSYSYETHTVTEGAYIGDAFLRADLPHYRPRFNASGTKFLYNGTAAPAGWCEVDWATQTVVGEAQLFPYAQNTVDVGGGSFVAPVALADAVSARAEAAGICPPLSVAEYSASAFSACSPLHVWYAADVVHAAHRVSITGGCLTLANTGGGNTASREASFSFSAISVDGAIQHRTQKLRWLKYGAQTSVPSGADFAVTKTKRWEFWAWSSMSAYPASGAAEISPTSKGTDGKHLLVGTGNGGFDHNNSYANHYVFEQTNSGLNNAVPEVTVPTVGGELSAPTAYLVVLKKINGAYVAELCHLPVNHAAIPGIWHMATNRKETDVVVSMGTEHDPEGYSAAFPKASYLLWLDKKRVWRNLKGKIKTGNATSDETVRVVSLIAIDKDRGYYEDDFFTS